MPILRKAPNAASHLRSINRCRIFLKALTIADITSADGKTIRKNVWEGKANVDKHLARHQLQWPQQRQPSRTDWQHWRAALKSLLTPYTATKYLRSPLGPWQESEYNNWKWFLDTPTDTLWERNAPTRWNTYSHHGMHGRPTAGIYLFAQVVSGPGPVLPVRAEIDRTPLGDIKILSTSPCPEQANNTTPTSLSSLIKCTLSPSQQYLVNILSTPSDRCLQHIRQSIIDESAIIVSDGSFFPESNESAFHTILESGDKQHSIMISQRVPGNKQDFDSFRAEVAGIAAGKILLVVLCKYLHITHGKVTQYCDGKSALQKCASHWKVNVKEPHHDILQVAHETTSQLPSTLQIQQKWIRGHQDATTHFDKLPRPHQLNIICDEEAKRFAKSAAPEAPNQLATKDWSIHWNGTRQVNNLEERLRDFIESPALIQYWKSKGIMNVREHPTHQSAIRVARKLSPPAIPIGITKLMSNNAPTHGTLHKWKFRSNGQCPFCGVPNEDTKHMLQCTYPKGTERWKKSLTSLHNWMKRTSTRQDVMEAIINNLQAFRHGYPIHRYYPQEIQAAITSQSHIGWENFLFGMISPQWHRLQHHEYKTLGTKHSSLKWAGHLIKHLWDIVWQQWKTRCALIHQNAIQTPLIDTALDSKIRQEHGKGIPCSCPPHFKYIFTTPLEQILRYNLPERSQWLKLARTARAATLNNNERRGLRRQQNCLRAFLNLPLIPE